MPLIRYVATGAFAPKQLMFTVFGPYKSGKSRFALSAPPPLFIANLDHDVDYLLNEVCKDAEIYLDNIWPSGTKVTEAEVNHLVSRVDTVAAAALQRKEGTLIIDGGSRLYNYLQIKYLGASFATGKQPSSDSSQFDWSLIYQHLTQLLQPFQQTDCNVIFTLEAKEKYESVASASSGKMTGRATGELVPRGPKPIGYTMHLQLQTFVRTVRDTVVGGKDAPKVCNICGQPIGRGQHTEYWCRFDWSAYRDAILRGRDICNPTFDKIRALLCLQGPAQAEAEKVLAQIEAVPVVDLSKLEGEKDD
jgi:hypothetical protein